MTGLKNKDVKSNVVGVKVMSKFITYNACIGGVKRSEMTTYTMLELVIKYKDNDRRS